MGGNRWHRGISDDNRLSVHYQHCSPKTSRHLVGSKLETLDSFPLLQIILSGFCKRDCSERPLHATGFRGLFSSRDLLVLRYVSSKLNR